MSMFLVWTNDNKSVIINSCWSSTIFIIYYIFKGSFFFVCAGTRHDILYKYILFFVEFFVYAYCT